MSVGPEDLKLKRRIAALRMMAAYLSDESPDRGLYAMNVKQDLTDRERSMLLRLFMDTFPPDQAEEIVRDALKGAGYPSPVLTDDALSDARFWASQANANELKAYAMACVERMSKGLLAGFKKWVEGRNA